MHRMSRDASMKDTDRQSSRQQQTKNLLRRGYIDPENIQKLSARNHANELDGVEMTEDQRKVLKLREDVARRMKEGEEINNADKILSLNLIYGIQNVLKKTKEHGFDKVTSHFDLLNPQTVQLTSNTQDRLATGLRRRVGQSKDSLNNSLEESKSRAKEDQTSVTHKNSWFHKNHSLGSLDQNSDFGSKTAQSPPRPMEDFQP